MKGARHIDLLAEVFHRLLEQYELIHVELLLLACSSLGSHATARTTYRRDDDMWILFVFIFNGQVCIFYGHDSQ